MHRKERQIMHHAKRRKEERLWLNVYPPILSKKNIQIQKGKHDV